MLGVLYVSVIGNIMYVKVCTYLDISRIVSMVNIFTRNPGKTY